jgi:hypothetical protein
MTMTVYGLVDPRTDEVFYVGITSRGAKTRLASHLSEARSHKGKRASKKTNKILSIISKGYAVHCIILEENSHMSYDELKEKEKKWIKHYLSINPNITNLTMGGDGALGYKHLPEARRKMSKKRKGIKPKPISQEGRKKISESNSTRVLSSETKKKLSNSLSGKSKSLDTKKRMSDSHKGKVLSEEHKKNISNARKGMKFSKETREKMSRSHSKNYKNSK